MDTYGASESMEQGPRGLDRNVNRYMTIPTGCREHFLGQPTTDLHGVVNKVLLDFEGKRK